MSNLEAAGTETGFGNNDSQVELERTSEVILGRMTTDGCCDLDEDGNPRSKLRSWKTQLLAESKMDKVTLYDRDCSKAEIMDLKAKFSELEKENGRLRYENEALQKLSYEMDRRNAKLVEIYWFRVRNSINKLKETIEWKLINILFLLQVEELALLKTKGLEQTGTVLKASEELKQEDKLLEKNERDT